MDIAGLVTVYGLTILTKELGNFGHSSILSTFSKAPMTTSVSG